jgi:hypothetical protein
MFLAGMEASLRKQGDSVKANARVTPKLVGDQLKFVLDVCQVGSHRQSDHEIPENKPSILEVEKWNPNHQLLETATLMTLDFIVWTKAYIEANPDPIENMKNWECNVPAARTDILEDDGVVLKPDYYGNYFVRIDAPNLTGGENVRLRKQLILGSPLSIGSRVRIKFRNTRDNLWEAESYEGC